MPYTANVYRVFIASPGDVLKERGIIRDTLIEWNAMHAASRGLFLDPIGWETHAVPALGERPQAIINKQLLEDADLLIGVFWTRLGTATGEYASGTVEEIERHIAADKAAMIYFSNAPVRLDSVDDAQYKALREFRTDLQTRGLVFPYEDHTEFGKLLNRQLTQLVNSRFAGTSSPTAPKPAPGPKTIEEATGLSRDALVLLVTAAEADGNVIKFSGAGAHGLVQAGQTPFDTSTARLGAKWISAVEQLAHGDYIRDVSYKGEIYNVTDRGYKVADVVKEFILPSGEERSSSTS